MPVVTSATRIPEFQPRSFPVGVRPPELQWIWHGFVTPGNLTLLTSFWKAGKTTLVTTLLSKMVSGGLLAGLPVRAGRAIVVTEEGEQHWASRAARWTLGDAAFICRPFCGQPSPEDWGALIDRLVEIHAEKPLDLVVIDPLASFLAARTENDARSVLAAVSPLQRLTKLGIAVLVLHHPRKAKSAPGLAARGTGALAGFADIIIEMNWVSAPDANDRRRKLSAFSRHTETVHRLMIEQTPDGTDYISHGEFEELETSDSWPVLRGVLESASEPQTAQAIRAAWPENHPWPSEATLWRWLDVALREGCVTRSGTGRRNHPFEYGLAATE